MNNIKNYKDFIGESIKDYYVVESIKDYLKPKEISDINKIIDIRDKIYQDQHKCKYDILIYLTSIGFKFDYPIELKTEPTMFDSIGKIVITDFIKEHKKIIPNFNNLSYVGQDKAWDDSIDEIISEIDVIMFKYDFSLKYKGVKYGQGDLLLEFITKYDDLLTYSKNVPKVISDQMLKK